MANILVVGGRKSGVYAAILAKKLGNSVFLTEKSENEEILHFKKLLDDNGIQYEIGRHSFGKIHEFDLAVLSPGVPLDSEIVKFIREKGISYIGEMEFAYRQSLKASIIAVTGTNGKSTTTALIGYIFSDLNSVTGGNLGTPFSALLLENPSPQFAILETSCFQLESIESYHPHIVVFLNFTEDHLDRYSSMTEYLSAKKRIFANQNESDFAIFNYDDSVVKELSNETKAKDYYFSISKKVPRGAYLNDSREICFVDEMKEEILFPRGSIQLIGIHNVQNVLASVIAAKLSGLNNELIRQKIESFNGLQHRLEKVKEINGVLYINDSKSTTPDSTIVALNSFERPIILIAGGSSKNNDFSKLAKLFPEKLKKLILIGQTAREIGDAAVRAGFGEFVYALSLKEAVAIAKNNSNNGDIVLLSPACASFDMFSDFEDRGEQFKMIVESLE